MVYCGTSYAVLCLAHNAYYNYNQNHKRLFPNAEYVIKLVDVLIKLSILHVHIRFSPTFSSIQFNSKQFIAQHDSNVMLYT